MFHALNAMVLLARPCANAGPDLVADCKCTGNIKPLSVPCRCPWLAKSRSGRSAFRLPPPSQAAECPQPKSHGPAVVPSD